MQIFEGNHYGKGLSLCIIASRFNDRHVNRLLDGALQVLSDAGVEESDIRVIRVPGALEIPLVAQQVLETHPCNAIVALGCVIRGETAHFDSVVRNCSHQLMQVSLRTRIPITQAVLGVHDDVDAEARCGGKINRGEEAANAALEMANLMRQLSE